MAQTLHQWLCQGAQTGAYFNHGLSGPRSNRSKNGIDDAHIGQEMLAKTLSRNMFHGLSRPGAAQALWPAEAHALYCGNSRSST